MPAPNTLDAQAYLEPMRGSWSAEDITKAFAAEKAAQARVCSVPADDAVWPADLAEALFRRTAHNLALRALPLGFEEVISETSATGMRVGGTDAEVRRLEAPYRRLVVG